MVIGVNQNKHTISTCKTSHVTHLWKWQQSHDSLWFLQSFSSIPNLFESRKREKQGKRKRRIKLRKKKEKMEIRSYHGLAIGIDMASCVTTVLRGCELSSVWERVTRKKSLNTTHIHSQDHGVGAGGLPYLVWHCPYSYPYSVDGSYYSADAIVIATSIDDHCDPCALSFGRCQAAERKSLARKRGREKEKVPLSQIARWLHESVWEKMNRTICVFNAAIVNDKYVHISALLLFQPLHFQRILHNPITNTTSNA